MVGVTRDVLSMIKTQRGVSLLELSQEKPVMLVFLRHFGCVFCKEAMSDLAEMKDAMANQNVHLVLTHLSDNDTAQMFLEKYNLVGVDVISDPDALTYKKFGLLRGNFNQVFGLKVWLRTVDAGILQGHGISRKQIGDGFQMPGIFVLKDGEIRSKFIHKSVADRPDYQKLIEDSVN